MELPIAFSVYIILLKANLIPTRLPKPLVMIPRGFKMLNLFLRGSLQLNFWVSMSDMTRTEMISMMIFEPLDSSFGLPSFCQPVNSQFFQIPNFILR